MKRKEITMTISEFIVYTEMSEFEKFYSRALTDNNVRKLVIVSLALGLMLISAQANAGQVNTTGIDKLGNTFLTLLQKGGYWICLVMGIKDILRQLMKGGDNIGDVGKVIVKYVLAFASLHMLPYLFDLAKECFVG